MKKPRMLGCTLTHVRQRPRELTQEELATVFGVTKNTVSSWENSRNIHYNVLQMYQDWYGLPNGVLLCISHLVASARDAATHPDEAERQRHLSNVRAVATMMKNVADRVLSADSTKTALPDYPFDSDDKNTWGAPIETLLDAARSSLSQESINNIKDLSRYPDAKRQVP